MYIISNDGAYNIDFIKKISITEYESNIQIIFRIPGEYFFIDVYNTHEKSKKKLLELCVQALNYIKEKYSYFIDYNEFQDTINGFINGKYNV